MDFDKDDPSISNISNLAAGLSDLSMGKINSNESLGANLAKMGGQNKFERPMSANSNVSKAEGRSEVAE